MSSSIESLPYFEAALQLQESGQAFVSVTVVEVTGSTPQEAGSRMIVTAGGGGRGGGGVRRWGTVGGGKIEARCIEEAGKLLTEAGPGRAATRCFEWNLQRDIGMTCGGVVRVFFEAAGGNSWEVVVFGAGHVAQALVRVLELMPCRVRCYDPRAEWIEKLPRGAGIEARVVEDLAGMVDGIDERASVLCMTMGHKSDRPVLERAMKLGKRFAFLGVIGSKSKAAVLRRELMEAGIPEETARGFECPVGLPIGTNHPGEIAVSIAAQLIEVRDRANAGAPAK